MARPGPVLLYAARARPARLSHPQSRLPAHSLPRRTLTTTAPTRRGDDSAATPNPSPSSTPTSSTELPDHRRIGAQQKLFTTSIYSPGSPLLLPHGKRIANRLVDFLRRQYVRYGFDEVDTPTIYKKSLWEKSGHLENYADDMFSVTSNPRSSTSCCGGAHEGESAPAPAEAEEDEGDYGLKPMNCPGHCLIFASEPRSYADLPIRYADFSPLHRNEVSGALTGLTRVRRFHQDDGHIFCRPSQVEREIRRTLGFVRFVYSVLRLGVDYRLALSTRPLDHYIGSEDEWERAESALRRALDASGQEWSVNEGDGAFYGPKIDIILRDPDGKEHQTATIQLDFQLPKRFGLKYEAPAPELEARGESTDDPALLAVSGPVAPVMIHRAVLGSVERLMALLIERHGAAWPFWLNPRQAVILTVNDAPETVAWAQTVRNLLEGHGGEEGLESGELPPGEMMQPNGLVVDLDSRAITMGRKKMQADAKGYGIIVTVGSREAADGTVSVSGQSIPGGRKVMTPSELLATMQKKVATFQ
ncbi:related to threonine--tRNA ligase [Cephalotrichum gorgonifer]|uniref:threonine--tRNA ligase n=1 Tax=Cephalotrichum gorgonifer TaxID=2041049 RepID=A0AAE8MZX6_9PEZI|nr:related to threonine--tRNA ligase [Cephalotrichum gorgonifer]